MERGDFQRFLKADSAANAESVKSQLNIAQQQARAAQTTAEAARKQALTAQKQFESADRPWIGIEVSVSDPLTYDGRAAHIGFNFIPKNVGRSPAQSIWIWPTLIVGGMGSDVREEEKHLCEHAIAQNQPSQVPWSKYTLFPNEFYSQKISLELPAEKITSFTHEREVGLIPILLVGCVDYVFGPASQHHQTGFIYEVLMRDGSSMPHKSKTPIAPELLGIMQLGGQYAN